MTREKMAQMEKFIEKMGGNLDHVKRVLYLSKIIAEKEGILYNDDILVFASYFHDVGAYPPYAREGQYDHAEESAKLIPQMAEKWEIDESVLENIIEAVKYHHIAGMGRYIETRLIRNADGLDYLGFMAVARDFCKQPKDMRKAVSALKKRKAMFTPCVDLEYAKVLAMQRIAELDNFIERFEEESFGIY